MNTRQIIIIVLTALYLNLRLLSDFNHYDINLFYTYLLLVVLTYYPMNAVNLYFNKISHAITDCKLSVQKPTTLYNVSSTPCITSYAPSLLTIFMKLSFKNKDLL